MLLNALQTQTPSYKEPNKEFLDDICDFFAGRRAGHAGTWRYSEPLFKGDKVNGMYHWGEFVKTARAGSAYYVVNDELDVIRRAAPQISNVIPGALTAVDMGPGSKEAVLEKVGPFLNTGMVSSYVAVDIVKECVERTAKIVAEHFPEISFFGLNRDFYREPMAFPVSGTPVMMMFGQTLFNLPVDPLDANAYEPLMMERLLRFRMHLGTYGYLVITQDCNQDGQSLYDAYMTEADFDLNLLYRIQRDLPVSDSFNPDDFAFEPCWVPETGAASHTYVAKKDLHFSIGDEAFSLKRGQRFYMHNTYKFSVDQFLAMARRAYFEPVFTEKSHSGRVALHVLKAV